jgi:NADH dehydrogenase
VVVGAGFAGLNAAQVLGATGSRELAITVLDRRNHHLFQPLLYQVATAGLSPADISAPIRSVLRGYANVEVRLAEVSGIDLAGRVVHADTGEVPYDYLSTATSATRSGRRTRRG